MFSNFFQSVKEIAHGPSVQDGQKIRKSSNASMATTPDEEMTEEGFVSIGRSSFICQSSDPLYPPLNGMETMTTHNPHIEMPMPFGQSMALGHAPLPYQNFQTHPSLEINEVVRNVPMVLHPTLAAHIQMYDPMKFDRGVILTSKKFAGIDFSQFNYDFEFERGVLRDIDQQIDIASEDNNSNSNNPNWTADWEKFY